MILTKPKIFSEFPNVIFGFSKKYDEDVNDRFSFNMSKSIGDDENIVFSNRSYLFSKIGLNNKNVIIQKQTHSDIVNVVDQFTTDVTGDALITKKINLGLAISTADCTNIYLYDSKNNIIAAVHAGWKGSELKILRRTLIQLFEKFNSKPENLFIYFGPSICQKNYEVGEEFLGKFGKKFLLQRENKIFLDLKSINKDILLEFGVPTNQIEISKICSFENNNFHSFRRDKDRSGRALGVIALVD